MSSYIVTIEESQPADRAKGRTQICIDLSSGRPQVTQVLVTAGSGGGLGTADLTGRVDLEQLASAFLGTPPATEPDTAPDRPRPRRATVAPPAPAPAASETDAATRTYRKMPDPAEVLAAYRETGSITRLAEHYGVPRHTAQGWAGRLRKLGFSIGRA
ncbi:hypothetical protein [Actinosynnema sp. NPDC020468]|uniref:hypothetical protein n=1 Tax=Actinosynnema sp. NPDC020468 TaxID=3154488 RepID=UPI0033C601C8